MNGCDTHKASVDIPSDINTMLMNMVLSQSTSLQKIKQDSHSASADVLDNVTTLFKNTVLSWTHLQKSKQDRRDGSADLPCFGMQCCCSRCICRRTKKIVMVDNPSTSADLFCNLNTQFKDNTLSRLMCLQKSKKDSHDASADLPCLGTQSTRLQKSKKLVATYLQIYPAINVEFI